MSDEPRTPTPAGEPAAEYEPPHAEELPADDPAATAPAVTFTLVGLA
jgi:hypothetical protein